MAGITAEQAIDLGYATLQAYEPNAVQMALKKTTYEVVNRWFPKAKKLDGGKKVTFDLSLGDTGNGMFKKMYQTDTPNVANVVKEGEVQWVDYQNSFSYAIQELEVNRGNKTRIFDLLRNRKLNCARETADDLEGAGWITPESATDTDKPHGIAGWIVPGTADSTGDFYGYLPHYTTADDASSAYSTIAGLSCSSTANNRFANWYADHNGKLDDSCLKLLRRAIRKTHFQTPVVADQAIDPESDFSNFRLYTNSDVLDEFEEIATKSDDQIGTDLGKYAGAVIFKRIPIIYIDELDTDRTYIRGGDPIYGINHNHFYPVVLSGINFEWRKPMNKVGQHDVFTVYLDLRFAYVCDNRKAGGFLLSNYQSP